MLINGRQLCPLLPPPQPRIACAPAWSATRTSGLSHLAVGRYHSNMSTLPANNPLVANSQRQAHASIAGYIYQIEQSILRWINLQPDQALYLEGVEDCDVYSSQDQNSQAWQFKARANAFRGFVIDRWIRSLQSM